MGPSRKDPSPMPSPTISGGAARAATRDRVIATDALLFETFLDLVRIPSPSRAERRVGEYVRAFCAGRGLAVREDGAAAHVGGDCGNLIVDLPATDPARAGDTVA